MNVKSENIVVAQRRKLRAEILENRRKVLPALRKALRDAQKSHKKRLKQCKTECKAALRKARQRAVLARRKLAIFIAKAKSKARDACGSCKTIDERGVQEISTKIAELEQLRREIDKLRAQASMMVSARGRAAGRRSAELRSESDDQVIRDLGDDKELITLFKQIRNKIKPSKYRNRTEAFLEWVQDHPEALEELRSKQENAWTREAERHYRELQPEANGNSCWGDYEKCSRELEGLKRAEKHLSEVPF